MGSAFSSAISSIFYRFFSFCFPRFTNQNTREPLPDIEEGKGKPHVPTSGPTSSPTPKPTPKRRALLVGISYHHSQSDTWWPLENPHGDVDMFKDLLVRAYGYSADEITVLKDRPDFPNYLQPTRANMIRELKKLVADPGPGDKFTFFYSGHSDQQISFDDISVEEDGQDEVIVTSDIQRIVDNELNDILVKPLPNDTFLLAVFDTCHSGTMLDLPHHHCNSVYVPWLSKGVRATLTLQNNNVRHYAMGHMMGLSGLQGSAYPLPSIAGVIAYTDSNNRSPTDPLPSPCPRLKINTQVRESTDQSNRRWRSVGDSGAYRADVLSPTRYDSPVSNIKCDGWCKRDIFARRVALSLSACSDPQRAWEGPRGSLTTVLCNYLHKHPRPSYRKLMSHVNFALHENARELHAYTRKQRKDGNDFDGELDNFQEPKLSSLWKLNMDEIFQL